MPSKESGMVRFVAKYEDGNTAVFSLPLFDLRSGDHIARVIAREMQMGGRLPKGRIISVERSPIQDR